MKSIRRVPLNTGFAEADELREVEIGDRVVPQLIRVEFPGVGGQPGLQMTIDSSSGVPRCTKLLIVATEGSREVRSTDVRSVQIEAWIDAIVPLFARPIVERTKTGRVVVVRGPDSQADDERRARAVVRQARREARRTITDDLLRRVAEIDANEDRPHDAVMAAFTVSDRTAWRYLKEARKRFPRQPSKGDA